MLDNVNMTILVNGTWSVDAGSMVELSIFDPDINKKEEEYKPLTGKYIVKTCIDKINMGHFTQKLELIRADEK